VLSGPSISLPKIAILALYMRLFKPEKLFRIVSWITVCLCIVFAATSFSVAAAACAPKHGIWQLRMECGSWMTMVGVVGGACWLFIDFVIFALPIPVIRKLNMPPRKKLGLVILFAVGIL
jgi:hypothetical protein